MKKKVLLIPLALLLVVSLVACAAPAPAPATTAPAPATTAPAPTTTAPAPTTTAPTPATTAPTPAPAQPSKVEYEWRFAAPYTTSAVKVPTELMCDLIGVYSDGRMKVDFYPDNLLGSHDETFHAVQEGSVEMATLCPYANLVPGGVINSMPFAVSSYDESAIMYAPESLLSQAIETAWNEVGFHVLWSVVLGTLGIANNMRPLKTPDDFENMKFRVSGSVQAVRCVQNMAEGTGLTTQTLPWADLYNALERGVMDGCWESYSSLVEYRHTEVLTYFTPINFYWDAGQIVINKQAWDELPADLQDAVSRAAEMAELVCYERARRGEKVLEKQVVDAGVEIYYITPQERAVFMEKANTPAIWEELMTPWLAEHFPGQNMTQQILDEIAQAKALVSQ